MWLLSIAATLMVILFVNGRTNEKLALEAGGEVEQYALPHVLAQFLPANTRRNLSTRSVLDILRGKHQTCDPGWGLCSELSVQFRSRFFSNISHPSPIVQR